jgi:hypothetical protein
VNNNENAECMMFREKTTIPAENMTTIAKK